MYKEMKHNGNMFSRQQLGNITMNGQLMLRLPCSAEFSNGMRATQAAVMCNASWHGMVHPFPHLQNSSRSCHNGKATKLTLRFHVCAPLYFLCYCCCCLVVSAPFPIRRPPLHIAVLFMCLATLAISVWPFLLISPSLATHA